jgi:hypothetical protein
MDIRSRLKLLIAPLVFTLLSNATAAQDRVRNLALKNGETVELFTIYQVARCRSILIGKPEVEVLDGTPELSFSIKDAMVVPRNATNCSQKVQGGILEVTANNVTEKKEAKVTIRINYKTKDGPRQNAGSYTISLYP